jgi:hypothetical protein
MRCLALVIAVAACSHARPPIRPAPPPRVVKPVPPSPPALTPDVVLDTIRTRYIAGLERCYGAQLRRGAAVRGKVTVTLTIGETGRPSARQARGVGPRVERCIETAMGRWAFPPARPEQSFQLSLLLRPV